MLQEFTETAIDFTETEACRGDGSRSDDDNQHGSSCRQVSGHGDEAVSIQATDIHVEPFADRVRIRYRIDGELIERDSPPRRLLGAIVSRIKIMARMDIAEKLPAHGTAESRPGSSGRTQNSGI